MSLSSYKNRYKLGTVKSLNFPRKRAEGLSAKSKKPLNDNNFPLSGGETCQSEIHNLEKKQGRWMGNEKAFRAKLDRAWREF